MGFNSGFKGLTKQIILQNTFWKIFIISRTMSLVRIYVTENGKHMNVTEKVNAKSQ